VDIEFSDQRLRKVVESRAKMQKKYGSVMTEKIAQRLAALEAADTMEELRALPGKWHPLVGDYAGCWAAHLEEPYRLIVKPDPPGTIVIIEIVDYH
jgi:proteic killer suppression protein